MALVCSVSGCFNYFDFVFQPDSSVFRVLNVSMIFILSRLGPSIISTIYTTFICRIESKDKILILDPILCDDASLQMNTLQHCKNSKHSLKRGHMRTFMCACVQVNLPSILLLQKQVDKYFAYFYGKL